MKHKDRDTFHIYGRTSYSQPLELVEIVTLSEGQEPEIPQGVEWVEVIAFPQAAIIQVIPQPKEKGT